MLVIEFRKRLIKSSLQDKARNTVALKDAVCFLPALSRVVPSLLIVSNHLADGSLQVINTVEVTDLIRLENSFESLVPLYKGKQSVSHVLRHPIGSIESKLVGPVERQPTETTAMASVMSRAREAREVDRFGRASGSGAASSVSWLNRDVNGRMRRVIKTLLLNSRELSSGW